VELAKELDEQIVESFEKATLMLPKWPSEEGTFGK